MTYAQSLKDRRMVLRSLIERLRNEIRASVADVSDPNAVQSAAIDFSLVHSSMYGLEQSIANLRSLLARYEDQAELIELKYDYLPEVE